MESLVTGEPRGPGVSYVEARVGRGTPTPLTVGAGSPSACGRAGRRTTRPSPNPTSMPRPAGAPVVITRMCPASGARECGRRPSSGQDPPWPWTPRPAPWPNPRSRRWRRVSTRMRPRGSRSCPARAWRSMASSTLGYVYLSAHARRGDDVQTGMGFATGRAARRPGRRRRRRRGEPARRVRLLGRGAVPDRTLHRDLRPRGGRLSVFGVIAQALTAEAVQKGRSLFAGRVGQRVAAARFSLCGRRTAS